MNDRTGHAAAQDSDPQVQVDGGAVRAVAHDAGSVGSAMSLERDWTWAERLSDRANPILVREVLQALHGRGFLLALATAVAAVILIALGVLGMRQQDGREVFFTTLSVLAPLVVFVLPLLAFMNMRQEVVGGTVEQMLMTRLRPWRIVFGKLEAAGVLFVIFLGMFAPVLGMTFLLRGVAAPTVVVAIVWILLASLLANAFAIAMAALGRVRFLAPVTLIATVVGLGAGTVGAIAAILESMPEVQSLASTGEFWQMFLGVVLAFLAAVWLLGAIAVACLAHEHENRSTAFRGFVLTVLAVSFAWFMSVVPAPRLSAALPGFAMGMAFILGPILLISACEREALSPRVSRYVPRRPWLAALMVPLLPGGGRALLLAMITAGLVLAPLMFGRAPAAGAIRVNEVGGAIVIWCYLLIFAACGRAIRARSRPTIGGFWWAVVATCLLVLLGAMWSLVVFAVTDDHSYSVLHVPNAIWTFGHMFFGRGDEASVIVATIALAALVLSWRGLRAGVHEVLAASRARRRLEA